MDLNRAFNLFMRFFGRKLMDMALKKGIDHVASRGKPENEMTEAERAQAASGRKMADTAKQIRNATRRFF